MRQSEKSNNRTSLYIVQLSLLLTKRSSTSLIVLCVGNSNAKLQNMFYTNVSIGEFFQALPEGGVTLLWGLTSYMRIKT